MTNNSLRDLRRLINNNYRVDEETSVKYLLSKINFNDHELNNIQQLARVLVAETRVQRKKQTGFEKIINQYDLTSDEGIALMCLAEALLRIPDQRTRDLMISDKISNIDWLKQMGKDQFWLQVGTECARTYAHCCRIPNTGRAPLSRLVECS